ncbi:hypothetical protein AVEN_115910-1 [Araneus ventricosus]|uniref:Uncharacterized protein n=1 Tax=Araneus ventricosus TaxID=182803 RepID=A0A4Y2PT48_ARAVE|nr:hypothetical protein AVEN_115910-1 [Araneus ventricosus]
MGKPRGARFFLRHPSAPCTQTRWIISGIGFRVWNSPAPKPKPYHASHPSLSIVFSRNIFGGVDKTQTDFTHSIPMLILKTWWCPPPCCRCAQMLQMKAVFRPYREITLRSLGNRITEQGIEAK